MMMLRYIDLMDNPLIDSNPGGQAHVQVSDVASDELDSFARRSFGLPKQGKCCLTYVQHCIPTI